MAVTSFNHFPAIAKTMHSELKKTVKETATHMVTTYASTCARDTGFMASSAYVVTSDSSTYGQTNGSPPGNATLLPEAPKPTDDLTAIAAVAASYAIFPELGTRYQAAQPAWYPAVEAERPLFDARLAKIDGKLRGSIR